MSGSGQISREKKTKRRNADPEYVERRKIWSREHYKRNKDRINEKRYASRKELRILARELGHCSFCFKAYAKKGFNWCEKCQNKNNERYKKRKV